MSIEYVTGYTVTIRPVQLSGILQLAPGQAPSGYGNRISTDYMVHLPDTPPHRLYRVYAICYSNTASHYIIRKGKQFYLKDHELEAGRDAARAIPA